MSQSRLPRIGRRIFIYGKRFCKEKRQEAVFPKRLITFKPMQYVRLRGRKEEADIFCGEEAEAVSRPTITHGQYLRLTGYLKDRKNPALLPVQIAYYTGLRIGEVCGLTWQDINLDEQYLRYAAVCGITAQGTRPR